MNLCPSFSRNILGRNKAALSPARAGRRIFHTVCHQYSQKDMIAPTPNFITLRSLWSAGTLEGRCRVRVRCGVSKCD